MLEKASGLTAGIDFSLAFSPGADRPGQPGLRHSQHAQGRRRPDPVLRRRGRGVLRRRSAIRSSGPSRPARRRWPSCWRTPTGTSTSPWSTRWRSSATSWTWTCGTRSGCAATKPFGFQAFYPGPGVGGHCIPIDPNYLSYKVRTLGYPFRFVELAQEINGRMPGYVTDRAAELLNRHAKPLNGAKVLLLGVTYKRDIADQRESPARPIARKLRARGAVVGLPRSVRAGLAGRRAGRSPARGPGRRAGRRRPGDPAAGAPGVRPRRASPRTARLLLDTRGIDPGWAARRGPL